MASNHRKEANMKKKIRNLIAATALTVGGVTVAQAGTAEATPYGCYWASTMYNSSGQMTGRLARCSFGTGFFRARLVCVGSIIRLGPWRSPGGSSSAQCPSGLPVTSSWVEVSN
jgi:hypothetical protein